ncbi:MAG: DUF3592 domain-containing protein [Bacteroidota bacterium]
MSVTKRILPRPAKFSLIINGRWGIIAFMVLLFGIVVSYNTLSSFDYLAMIYLNGNVEIGEGEVIDVYETNTSINDVSIYGYDYVFHSPVGDLNWTSFAIGLKYKVGDTVKIEYNNNRPDVNRIKGMSNTHGGFAFMIPFFVAICWIIYNYIIGLKRIRIIKNGELAEGKLIYKEPTLIRINNRRVYELTFSFQSNSGKTYKATARTHKPEKFEDEGTKTLIYDRSHPEKSLLLDKLPWSTGKIIKERWS